MKHNWKRIGSDKYKLIPDNHSRFELVLEKSGSGYTAKVSGELVNEGKVYNSLDSAQEAALDAYDSYWADFE